jgi:hypothetical protein
MILVDTWLAYSQINSDARVKQKQFFYMLAEELIDNTYDLKGAGRSNSATKRQYQDARTEMIGGRPRSGVLTHLTPCKRLKKSNGENTPYTYQGRCKECQKKTTLMCSDCVDGGKHTFLCGTKKGHRCFLEHLASHHTEMDENTI